MLASLDENRSTGQGYRTRKISSKLPFDLPLLAIVLLLTAIGSFFLFDLTPTQPGSNVDPGSTLQRHLLFALVGLFMMYLFSKIEYQFTVTMFALPLLVAAMALALMQIFQNSRSGEPGRLLHLFGMNFDVPQLLICASCLCVLKLASLPKGNGLFPAVVAVLTWVLLALMQDLGSMVLFGCICGCLFFLKWPKLVVLLGAAISVTAIILPLTSDYVQGTISIWLDPHADPIGAGWEPIWLTNAVASGGLLGVGIGHGRLKDVLHGTSTQYILAGITQEIGLVGTLCILLLYGLLLWRIVRIALRCSSKLGFLYACLVIFQIAVPLVLQLFVITGILPVINVRIPFLSYGGTGLLLDAMYTGILLNVSRSIRTKRIGWLR